MEVTIKVRDLVESEEAINKLGQTTDISIIKKYWIAKLMEVTKKEVTLFRQLQAETAEKFNASVTQGTGSYSFSDKESRDSFVRQIDELANVEVRITNLIKLTIDDLLSVNLNARELGPLLNWLVDETGFVDGKGETE